MTGNEWALAGVVAGAASIGCALAGWWPEMLWAGVLAGLCFTMQMAMYTMEDMQ